MAAAAQPPPCSDCGRRDFEIDAQACKATCRCGLEMAWRKPAAAKPAKKGGPPRIQKWYAEMAKRLGGVPAFVIKEAQRVYSVGIKDPNRQGCTDLGLALASLDHALCKIGQLRSRAHLLSATAHRVSPDQLSASAATVARVTRPPPRAGGAHPPPAAHTTPTLPGFVSLMCAELRLKGGWAKAAEAVAARVLELGAGRDTHALTLAAAVCVLVVERHPPKEKVLPETIATAAGLGEAEIIESYTMDLLPHLQELLGASEQAILPRAPPRLSAPAPPVPESSKPKPVSRRRRGSRGRGGGGIGVAADAVSAGGGSGCGSGGGGCGGGVESAGGEGGDGAGAAVGGDVGEEAAGAAVALCVHCGESIGEGEGPELCQDCRADQCHSCGRVDPIATDHLRRCFGCTREAVLRSRHARFWAMHQQPLQQQPLQQQLVHQQPSQQSQPVQQQPLHQQPLQPQPLHQPQQLQPPSDQQLPRLFPQPVQPPSHPPQQPLQQQPLPQPSQPPRSPHDISLEAMEVDAWPMAVGDAPAVLTVTAAVAPAAPTGPATTPAPTAAPAAPAPAPAAAPAAAFAAPAPAVAPSTPFPTPASAPAPAPTPAPAAAPAPAARAATPTPSIPPPPSTNLPPPPEPTPSKQAPPLPPPPLRPSPTLPPALPPLPLVSSRTNSGESMPPPRPMPPPPARTTSAGSGGSSTGTSPHISPAMRASLAPGAAPPTFALDASDNLGAACGGGGGGGGTGSAGAGGDGSGGSGAGGIGGSGGAVGGGAPNCFRGGASAALSAEWERPMSYEELAHLMASPCRPATPSNAPPPPYPPPYTYGSASPTASPRRDVRMPPPLPPPPPAAAMAPASAAATNNGLPLHPDPHLMPPPPPPQPPPRALPQHETSPQHLCSPPWRPSAAGAPPLAPPLGGAPSEASPSSIPGGGRALVEWALATSRHPSPYMGVPQSPLHHACSSAVAAAASAAASGVASPPLDTTLLQLHQRLRPGTHPNGNAPAAPHDDGPGASVFSDQVRRSPRIAAAFSSPASNSPLHLSGVSMERHFSNSSNSRMSPWHHTSAGGASTALPSPGGSALPSACAGSPSLPRPLTDPREALHLYSLSSAAAASPGWLPDRPGTDPHYSLRASTLRQSPRLTKQPSPHAAAPGAARPASARTAGGGLAGRMPPPPPRPRPTDGVGTEAKRRKPSRDPNAPMTEEDISEWLEPDAHSLDQQYGSNFE